MSVTEGEDKPLKYPTMFNSADICILSKMDLSQATNFNEKLAIENILKISPNIKILETSAKSGFGIEKLAEYLISSKNDN